MKPRELVHMTVTTPQFAPAGLFGARPSGRPAIPTPVRAA